MYMQTYKKKLRKSIRFSLLLYPIFIGTMGTIGLITFITWIIPKEDLPSLIPVISPMFLFLYGTCAVSLIIRAVFFKKEGTDKHDH